MAPEQSPNSPQQWYTDAPQNFAHHHYLPQSTLTHSVATQPHALPTSHPLYHYTLTPASLNSFGGMSQTWASVPQPRAMGAFQPAHRGEQYAELMQPMYNGVLAPITHHTTSRRTGPSGDIINRTLDIVDVPSQCPRVEPETQSRSAVVRPTSSAHSQRQPSAAQEPRPNAARSQSMREPRQTFSAAAQERPSLPRRGSSSDKMRWQDKVKGWGLEASATPPVQSGLPAGTSPKLSRRATLDFSVSAADAARSQARVGPTHGGKGTGKGRNKAPAKQKAGPSSALHETASTPLEFPRHDGPSVSSIASPAPITNAAEVTGSPVVPLVQGDTSRIAKSKVADAGAASVTVAQPSAGNLTGQPVFGRPFPLDIALSPILPSGGGPFIGWRTAAPLIPAGTTSSPTRKRRAPVDAGDKSDSTKRHRTDVTAENVVPASIQAVVPSAPASSAEPHLQHPAADADFADESSADEDDGDKEDWLRGMERMSDCTSAPTPTARAHLRNAHKHHNARRPSLKDDGNNNASPSGDPTRDDIVTTGDPGDVPTYDPNAPNLDGTIQSLFPEEPTALELAPLGLF